MEWSWLVPGRGAKVAEGRGIKARGRERDWKEKGGSGPAECQAAEM